MKYNLLAKFKYSNKEYFIIKVQQQKIVFLIKENKKIRFDFSEEEQEIFQKVYNSLKITPKNSINLGIKYIEDKQYNIFYDKNTKLHYWFELANGKLKETDEYINRYFNFKYNNINTIVYEKDEDADSEKITNKFFQRIIKIGKKVVIVLLAAEISMIALSTCSLSKKLQKVQPNQYSYEMYCNNPETEITQNEKSELYQENFTERNYKNELKERELRDYNFEEIKFAIESNSKIGEEEKKILYNLKFLFDENHQYMDIDTIIERLKDLEIIYTEEYEGSIAGEYIIPENKINIYNLQKFSYEKIDIIMHEILHVLQVGEDYNRFTLELSNELTTREVLRRMNEMGLIEDSSIFKHSLGIDINYGIGYNQPMSVEYLLAEVLTKEQMQKYQFFPDENIIIEALLEIEGQPINQYENSKIGERAYTLLDSIDGFRQYDKYGNSTTVYTNEQYENVYNQIDYYYNKLYNKSMEENLAIDLLLWNRLYLKYSETDLISKEKAKATTETILEIVESRKSEEVQGIMFDSWVYTLPRTYLTNVHEYPICMYCLGEKDKFVSFEVDDSVEKLFLNNLMEEKEKMSEEKEH